MAETVETSNMNGRCRLVWTVNTAVLPADGGPSSIDGLGTCLNGGDVASIIFHDGGLDEGEFQSRVAPFVQSAQNLDVAAVVCGSTRVAGRVGADGLQLGQDPAQIKEAIGKFHPAMMIGAGNVKTRHNALVLGEMQPDYLMFGKPGGDTRPEPNPKNLELGAWWSSMVEIPCIVLGGTSADSAVDVARTGAEFVALGEAIFPSKNGTTDFDAAAAAIANINRLLDDHAPRFEQTA